MKTFFLVFTRFQGRNYIISTEVLSHSKCVRFKAAKAYPPCKILQFLQFKYWWYPQIMSKYLFVKYLLISKKTGALARAVKKNQFLGPHFGGFPWGVAPKTFGRPKLRLQVNNFTQKLDFDVLWFRRRAYKI